MSSTFPETFLSMMATDHAYCAASRPLLAISCLLAAFHGLKRTPTEAAFVATLTANLCDLAALSPGEVATGVEVIEAAIRVLIPPPPTTTEQQPGKQQGSPMSPTCPTVSSSNNNNNNTAKSNNGHAHVTTTTAATSSSSSASTTPTDVMDVSVC